MAKEDLIDISTRPDFKEITAKGGRVKSEAKTRASKLRAIRRMKPENIEKRAYELASSPKDCALEIMQMITTLKQRGELKPELEIQLIRALNDAYRTIYGNKVNLQANIQQEINLKVGRYQIEATKEFLIRNSLQEIILKQIEERLGYEAMITVWGIIHQAINEKSVAEIEKECEAKSVFVEKVGRLMKQGYTWEEAVRLAKEELEKEQKEKEQLIVIEN